MRCCCTTKYDASDPVFKILQNALNTRNSELHSLDELRSQFGQFRESVLKDLRPVPSPPPNPQSSSLGATSLRDTAAAILPSTSEEPATGDIVLDSLCATHNANASSEWISDDEVDDAHSPFAAPPSDSYSRTPQRRSPSSQSVAETLSPAEAGKQAHIIEGERDALLSSGLYHEHGKKFMRARITSMHNRIPQIH
jgi:hypothetical protein